MKAAPHLAELRRLVALAVPLVGTQVANVALPWTDALVLARLGPAELAAGGLGATLLSTAVIIVSCLLGALSAMIARARAEGRDMQARTYVEQARLLAAGFALPCLVVVGIARPLLESLGQPPAVAAGAGLYLAGAAPAFLAMPIAAVQRHAFAAAGRPKVVTFAWACAVPLNAALDLALGFGVGPIPGLGVLGIGVVTSVVSLLVVCVLEVALRRSEPALAGTSIPRPRPGTLRTLLALGGPIAIAVGAEVGIFAGAAVAAGWFGPAALAAHHVALQTTQLLFLAPNGWAQATAIRVASGAPHAARLALSLAASVSAGVAALLVLGRDSIVELYFPGGESAPARAASVLLLWVAAFHVADAVQVVAAGVLRGGGDTRTAMLWSLAAYACVAPAVGLGAAVLLDRGVSGIWMGLAVALWCAAVGLGHRALRQAWQPFA